jgi:RimJ/RimL family protein N-acetyltransferase
MVLIRHATPVEMQEPIGFSVDDPVASVDADRFREEAAAGRIRPEWTWFAEDGSRIVGRALWWGRADSECPLTLDCLHVLRDLPDRAALATELLSRGHAEFDAKPDYQLVLRTTRCGEDPDIAEAVAWRSEAAQAAGLTDIIQRLRFEWIPAAGVPAPSQRLVFRPATDAEFLAGFRRVAVGSLDVATQRDLAAMDPDSQAQGDLEFYRSCPGERSWWRLAETTDGELAGFAIPSATPYHRNVGYLGVVPELRGRGYIDDLLGEITRFHAADGADPITATTDVANTPMAAAFDRANYQVTEVRMVFQAPGDLRQTLDMNTRAS